MMKTKFYFVITCLLFAFVAKAQLKIGNNPNTISASSAVEIESTDKGLLIPRMTKAQKNAIATPATGLLVYQASPDSVGFHYYNGTAWLWLNPNNTGNDWKTTGNAGTDTAVNFIGTTDNEPIRIKQNNAWIGQWDGNKNNFFMGRLAGKKYTTGINNMAIGDSALFANSIGNDNVAIGKMALKNNIDGFSNIAIGLKTLQSNTTGNRNIAIGDESLGTNISGIQNIAIGYNTMPANTSGDNNTAMGFFSLLANSTGEQNSGYGLYSLYNNTTGNYNTGIGVRAGFMNTTGNGNSFVGYRSGNIIGSSNVGMGTYAMGAAIPQTINNTIAIGDSALFNIQTGAVGNMAVGSKSLYSNTTGDNNTAVGFNSLYSNVTGFGNSAFGNFALLFNRGSSNTAVGSGSLTSNNTGDGNTALGYSSLFNNVSGVGNTAIGHTALYHITSGNYNYGIGENSLSNRDGSFNIAIGKDAGSKSSSPVNLVSNNIFIGNSSGFNSTGNNNIFIGKDVGTSFTPSNILAIDNSSTTTPLIFGNFATDLLRINGTLNINNQYSFPLADGIANQVLRTNGAGTATWATPNDESTTAVNGLIMAGSAVALGGSLVANTTIAQGNNNMNFDLTGTGDFIVKNATTNGLFVKNNSYVGLNTADPLFRLHIANEFGGDGPFGRGIMLENTNTTTTGESSIAFKNTGPDGIPTNRAWMAGLNNFTNFVVAYGDTLKALNVKFKIDTSGNVSINTLGNPPQSKLDVKGSFGNGIEVVSADYIATDLDHTIIIGTGVGATPLTITLPAANTCNRREYVIVNRNASAKTITQYNDFSTTSTTIPGIGSITLQSNNVNWFRIR